MGTCYNPLAFESSRRRCGRNHSNRVDTKETMISSRRSDETSFEISMTATFDENLVLEGTCGSMYFAIRVL